MKRLRTPDFIAGLGGVLLLVGVLLEPIGVFSVLLILIALAAIAVPLVTAVSGDPAPAIKTDVLVAWATLIAIIVTLARTDFVALAGAVVAFAGCWWAMRLQAAPGLRTSPEVRAMPVPPANDPT